MCACACVCMHACVCVHVCVLGVHICMYYNIHMYACMCVWSEVVSFGVDQELLELCHIDTMILTTDCGR